MTTFAFLDMSGGIHNQNVSKLTDNVLENLDKHKCNVLPLTPHIKSDTNAIFMIDIDNTYGFNITDISDQIELELIKWYGINCSTDHYITFRKNSDQIKYHMYYYDIILNKSTRNYISKQINKRLGKPVLDILSGGIRIDCFNKFKNGKYISNSRYKMLDNSNYDKQFFERILRYDCAPTPMIKKVPVDETYSQIKLLQITTIKVLSYQTLIS